MKLASQSSGHIGCEMEYELCHLLEARACMLLVALAYLMGACGLVYWMLMDLSALYKTNVSPSSHRTIASEWPYYAKEHKYAIIASASRH